jgi:23S rRNA (uracil1939-C5)-methyltransferase
MPTQTPGRPTGRRTVPTPTRRPRPAPEQGTEPAVPEDVELTIDRLIPGGFGMGFAERRTILVPLAVPGDRLRVNVRGRRGGASLGKIDALLEPSPARIEAPCPHFGSCGGCDFQQLSYEHQLAAKVDFIGDCLRRIGGITYEADIPIVQSPDPWAYRGVAEWQVDPATGKVGYFARDSHDIEDVEFCPIVEPSLNAALAGVRSRLAASPVTERHEVRAMAGDDWAAVHRTGDPTPPPTTSRVVGNETFQMDPRVFYQANAALLYELTEEVVGSFAPKGSRFRPGTAIDLYSGVGLFTIPLARRFKRVIAVESDPLAVHYAELNAKNAGLDNIRTKQASVESWLLPNARHLGRVDAVVLDPPRTGAADAIPAIIRLETPKVIYVSCDPATLARDLKGLMAAGYRLDRLTAFDMFPQTHHVEVVVHLSFGIG